MSGHRIVRFGWDRRTLMNLRAHFEFEVQQISGQSSFCSFFKCWDKKGWFFYGREGREYYPKLKAAIAAWRLSR